jgi:hypothetical protein
MFTGKHAFKLKGGDSCPKLFEGKRSFLFGSGIILVNCKLKKNFGFFQG